MIADRRQLAASPALSLPRRKVTDLIAAAAAGALSTDSARRCSIRPSVCLLSRSSPRRPPQSSSGASVSPGGVWRSRGGQDCSPRRSAVTLLPLKPLPLQLLLPSLLSAQPPSSPGTAPHRHQITHRELLRVSACVVPLLFSCLF